MGSGLAFVALVLGLVFGFDDVFILLNAAERLQITAFAGAGIFARVYISAASKKIPGKLLNTFFPIDELLRSERGLDERAIGIEPCEESGAGIAQVTREFLIACPYRSEEHT